MQTQETAAPAPTAQLHLRTLALPRIGDLWPEQGGIFAGILRGEDGDYALIVPTDPAADIEGACWEDAIARAGEFKTEQHQDFAAANRHELALCFANVPDLFNEEFYWSSTQYAGFDASAWYQSFFGGIQYGDRKGYELRARAVRRVPI